MLVLDLGVLSCFNRLNPKSRRAAMNFIRAVCLFSVMATGLSGCVTQQPVLPPVNSESDVAAVKLAEAASSVSQSLADLAAVQQAATPPLAFNALPGPDTYGLPGRASIDWSGPVEPLLRRIADACDYRVRVLGMRPAVPVVVTINAKDMPLGEMVRNIALQVAKTANVVVYPRQHVIELRYVRSG